jgi:signal transduction histidine kinase
LVLVPGAATFALVDALAGPDGRREAAAALARHLGADDLIVFVRDPDIGALRPAPGFAQTLPEARSWRPFLAECQAAGMHQGQVAFPKAGEMTSALAWTAGDGTTFVLLGGSPSLGAADFAAVPLALVERMLRAETGELAAAARAAAARDAELRTAMLARALDAARGETHAKALQLETALEEAARLNETLEQRVAQRTRELEDQTSERRKIEAAFLRAQKMEAVGQLTGGVAHDFNNLLSVLMGTLDLMEAIAGDSAPLQRHLKTAQRAVERGERLTQQLLAFARRQLLQPEVVDINQIIREAETLLRRGVGERVELRIEYGERHHSCRVDPAQFESALLNLAVNARDAMPSGGKLNIRVGTQKVTGRRIDYPEIEPGSYIAVTVTDTGIGIPPELADRVFEPFFTTKEVGKGTGLGLSQVYGFVKQSEGHVTISSVPGEGTTFEILLPMIEEGRPVAKSESEPTAIVPTDRSETVLAVEDDPDVLDIVLATLEGMGYSALIARNGTEALDVLNRPAHIDLLFTDLVMPGEKSGLDVAREARRLRPGIKVLLTSGYTQGPGASDYGQTDGFEIIGKPYRPKELAAKMRAVLGTSLVHDEVAGSRR